MEFKNYRRTQLAEMRPVTDRDIAWFKLFDKIEGKNIKVSISSEDLKNGSPKRGDMIARNPKNHKDQWLVSEQYFNDNFEPL